MPGDQPLIRAPGEGPAHTTPYGDTMIWIAGEAATNGGFSIHERTAPPGARSVPHVHHELIEAFYMLEGECEFIIGDRTFRGGPGALALAPKATTHAWTVIGDVPARMLVFFTPSAQLAFFEEQQAIVQSGADPTAMRALAEKYHWT